MNDEPEKTTEDFAEPRENVTLAWPPSSGLRQSGSDWPRPGNTLAERFRFQKLLGSGGNGEIWQAVNIQLGVKVAIKLPNIDKMSPKDLERFRREARALCLIHSEHVLRFFEYNTDPTPYLVMELLRGHDLAEHIKKHSPLSLTAVKAICRQLCTGLQAVHDAGIIHRDIKPSNIYCLGDPGKVKIVDFGIMKLVGPPGESSLESNPDSMPELTQEGSLLGTPQYMSPEQWSVTDQVIAFQSDLWSLAVVLYKLLTGEVPFNGKTFGLIARAAMYEPAPSLLEKRPDLPSAIDEFFQKALHKEPGRRFVSALDMGRVFEAIQEARPPSVSDAAIARPVPSMLRRAAALGVILLIGGVGGVSWKRYRYDTLKCSLSAADCDKNPENGCETGLDTITNCGGCGIACKNEHGATRCDSGACTPQCDLGFADCNNDGRDGCEANTSSDPAHCGTCDRVCGGAHSSAVCRHGVCALVCDSGFGDCNGDVADGCEATLKAAGGSGGLAGRCIPITIASDSRGALTLAADQGPDGSVYWANPERRTIAAVSKHGGPPTIIYNKGKPTAIARVGAFVVWTDTDDGTVKKYRLGDLTPIVVAKARCKMGCIPFGVAARGDRVFWTIRNPLDPTRMPELMSEDPRYKDGLVFARRDVTVSHLGLAVDGDSAFWGSFEPSAGGAIWRGELTGGRSVKKIAKTEEAPVSVVVEATGRYIYWTSISMSARSSGSLQAGGSITKTLKDGTSSSFEVLTNREVDPRAIAVDDDWVFWTSGAGTIRRIRKDGGGLPETLASDQMDPVGLVVDERSVFWVNQGSGTVMRISK